MVWTAQAALTSGQVLNSTYLNAYRDNLLSLRNGNLAYCKLYLDSNSGTIAQNTNTPVNWGVAEFQTGAIWSIGDPSRLFAPFTGKYLVLPNVEWQQNTANLRSCNVLRSAGGAAQYDGQSQGANGGKSNISSPLILSLTAGQAIRLQVFQSSGGGLKLHGGTADRTRISMLYLGEPASGSWVAPAAWALGTNPTHTQLNQALRLNPLAVRGLNDQCIRVHRTATQSITNGTRTMISWQAAAYQTGLTWSSGTNPTRITVGVTGTYLLAANLKFTNVVGGRRGVGYRLGSATSINFDLQFHPGNGVDTVTGIDLVDIAAGDYIEIYGYQNGGAITTSGTTEGDCWAALSLWATDTGEPPVWKTPRTWVDGFPGGTFMSPATLTTDTNDKLNSLRNFKGAGAMAWLEEDQSISQATRGPITFQQMTRNIGGLWEGQKFKAPVEGVYLVMLNVEWKDSSTAPVMGIGYRVNDSSTAHDMQFQEGDANGENQSGGDLMYLRKDDELNFFAYQTDSESASLHGGSKDRTRARVVLVAAAA